jgi:hypothetical protein
MGTKLGERPHGDDPQVTVTRILRSMGYESILNTVRRKGFDSISLAQRTALAEISRVAVSHHDPRIQIILTRALINLQAAFLEYCLTLKVTK